MDTLDQIIPERTTFDSPDSIIKLSRLIDAFVDDKSLGFMDPGYVTLETLVSKLTNIAQTWEQLLFFLTELLISINVLGMFYTGPGRKDGLHYTQSRIKTQLSS